MQFRVFGRYVRVTVTEAIEPRDHVAASLVISKDEYQLPSFQNLLDVKLFNVRDSVMRAAAVKWDYRAGAK